MLVGAFLLDFRCRRLPLSLGRTQLFSVLGMCFPSRPARAGLQRNRCFGLFYACVCNRLSSELAPSPSTFSSRGESNNSQKEARKTPRPKNPSQSLVFSLSLSSAVSSFGSYQQGVAQRKINAPSRNARKQRAATEGKKRSFSFTISCTRPSLGNRLFVAFSGKLLG